MSFPERPSKDPDKILFRPSTTREGLRLLNKIAAAEEVLVCTIDQQRHGELQSYAFLSPYAQDRARNATHNVLRRAGQFSDIVWEVAPSILQKKGCPSLCDVLQAYHVCVISQFIPIGAER